MNNYIVDTHKIFISPSGATEKYNGTMNSSLSFNIVNPVLNNPDIVYSTIRLLHAEIPNSFYIINNTNNLLALSTGNIILDNGNYTANTLITMLASKFPTGMTMTISNSTGKFTISFTSSFSVLATSTCYKLFGFVKNTVYTSVSNNITFPYLCNLLKTKHLFVNLSNFQFDNINPQTKDKTTLANIPVNVSSYRLILYDNRTSSNCIIKNKDMPKVMNLNIYDEDYNFVDFNNQEFSMTFEIINYVDNNFPIEQNVNENS